MNKLSLFGIHRTNDNQFNLRKWSSVSLFPLSNDTEIVLVDLRFIYVDFFFMIHMENKSFMFTSDSTFVSKLLVSWKWIHKSALLWTGWQVAALKQ